MVLNYTLTSGEAQTHPIDAKELRMVLNCTLTSGVKEIILIALFS